MCFKKKEEEEKEKKKKKEDKIEVPYEGKNRLYSVY